MRNTSTEVKRKCLAQQATKSMDVAKRQVHPARVDPKDARYQAYLKQLEDKPTLADVLLTFSRRDF
jgi:hypothetical protein